jgi:hypothetical protein
MDRITERLKSIIDEMLAFEKLPIRYEKTRNGWAGYRHTNRGMIRITKYHFSEEAAREDVTAQEARNIPVK